MKRKPQKKNQWEKDPSHPAHRIFEDLTDFDVEITPASGSTEEEEEAARKELRSAIRQAFAFKRAADAKKTSFEPVEDVITDPVIIGKAGEGAFLITSRKYARRKPIQGNSPVAWWDSIEKKWSDVMSLDRLVRFVPFEPYDAELAEHGIAYP